MDLLVTLFLFLNTLFAFLLPFCSSADLSGTVAFASVGRAHYAFDIYSLPIKYKSPNTFEFSGLEEVRSTDGVSVNFNGQFLDVPAIDALAAKLNINTTTQPVLNALAYVSERDGLADIYLDIYFSAAPILSQKISGDGNGRREILESHKDYLTVKFGDLVGSKEEVLSMKDRPSMKGDRMVFVSTAIPAQKSRNSWAAVYCTNLRTGRTKRLTPRGRGIADLSPALSPSGELVAVASTGEGGWEGQIRDLETDLYVFRASDGFERRLVAKHGGWPCWADDDTLFFHRQAEDGWWSVYRVSLSFAEIERITPPGIHAFTPAAAPLGGASWIVVATRRPDSEYRHIEIFDLVKKEFVELSKLVDANSHHYNPFVSGDRIGYHRCRGGERGLIPVLEHIRSPAALPNLSVFRVDGTFPSFSPDGSMIAYIPNIEYSGVYVMNLDGSGSRKIFSGSAFGTAWDWKRAVIYTSYGPGFSSEKTTVDIVAIYNADKEDGSEVFHKTLTKIDNNAFPSPSPDGRFVVFRSGRSRHKNLYIMDAAQGEEGGLWRLTEGPWTDTMCNWSPDGDWIAFASDRQHPGSGSFAMYFVHPNGTGLHMVLNSSTAGRVNHPWFSPDSKSLVFTSDYAGVSAEPISVPHQFQPYGEIFMARVDGSGLQRLTHNSYEDGTPSWGRVFLDPNHLAGEGNKVKCDFDDDTWLQMNSGLPIGSVKC
ncbi:uncharacterized protein LOC131056053 [Cryptomeria japonica]|uniref:uncharacterized protein LOC131056053 n=1 Tax=Cryptomeria japonica TaxID=3369 RepID=UPI0027DA6CC5|nr:uncharacterized protein LOC131056053 [Cryptomeria japonica]